MKAPGRGSVSKSRAKNLSSFLLIVARVVFVIFTLSCLAAAFPFQPWDPLWYLKVGQVAVDFSVTLLFSLVLALMARFFSVQTAKPSGQKKFIQKFVVTTFIVYALLVPVQLVSYGVHWYKTGRQNRMVIKDAEAQLAVLTKQIRAASSEEQLRAIVGNPESPSPSVPKPLSLAQQKNNLMKELEGPLFQLRTRLGDERQQHLITLGVGTAKGVLGASALAFGLRRMKRLLA
jgi:hypothetical protein